MSERRHLLPYPIVLTLGLILAVLQYVLDNKDPLVWSIPILVITFLSMAVIAIARRGGGGAGGELDRVAEEAGLTDAGIAPLPPVAPMIPAGTAPTRIVRGRLPGRGPRVRVALVRGRLVSLSETAASELDPETGDWLVMHPLRPEAAVEDGLLVLAVARDTGGRALLDLLVQAHQRLDEPPAQA